MNEETEALMIKAYNVNDETIRQLFALRKTVTSVAEALDSMLVEHLRIGREMETHLDTHAESLAQEAKEGA